MSMESNAQRKRQPDRPFYLPKGDTTSSRIITEAKESLNNRTGLQAVVTKRPSTPRDATRSLFGATSTRAPENRPPSSFRFVTLDTHISYVFKIFNRWYILYIVHVSICIQCGLVCTVYTHYLNLPLMKILRVNEI